MTKILFIIATMGQVLTMAILIMGLSINDLDPVLQVLAGMGCGYYTVAGIFAAIDLIKQDTPEGGNQ